MSNLPGRPDPTKRTPSVTDAKLARRKTRDERFDYNVNFRRLVPMMPILLLVAALALVVLYLVEGIWQILGFAGVVFLSSLAFFYAGWLVKRGRPGAERLATAVMLGTGMIGLPSVTLFISNTTERMAVASAIVSILVVALVVLPSRRWLLWALSLLAGLSVWLWASLPVPWTRFDINVSPVVNWSMRGFLAVEVLFIVAQFVIAYRRIRTLRLRLTALFAALSLLVALAISVTSVLVGIRIIQEQAYRQLESDLALKVAAVNSWVDQNKFATTMMIVEADEVQRARLLLAGTLTEDAYEETAARLRLRFEDVIADTQWFTEIFMTTREGVIGLSTDLDREGRSVADADYFRQGIKDLYVSPPQVDPSTGEVSVFFARPLISSTNYVYGIIVTRSSLAQLQEIMASGDTGETGVTYLVGPGNLLLTEPKESGQYAVIQSPALDAAVALAPVGASAADVTLPVGRIAYANHEGRAVFGTYTWVPAISSAMISEIDRSEVMEGARTTIIVNAGVAFLSMALAAVAGVWLSRSLSRPLVELADTATSMANGELDLVTAEQKLSQSLLRAPIDEVVKLTTAFSGMTVQLRDLVEGLEARVAERTRGLQAVTEVSRATTSVLSMDELLPQVVSLVQERFDLYYVGLFLIDQAGEYAVLRAGTGEAGAQMLAQGWRLRVDGGSMIGQSVIRGEGVIKQETAQDLNLPGSMSTAVSFENPLLPDTRSELAIPLRYGARVIGAMTIQSDRAAAFDETNIAIFQNMADQIGVVVQNARLFAETEEALERAQRVQSRYQTQAWSAYLTSRATHGYEYRAGEVLPLLERMTDIGGIAGAVSAPSAPGISISPSGELQVPVVQGGQVLGVIGVQRGAGGEQSGGSGGWTETDITLVEGLVEQLALAAENQRLLDETQRREAAERLTREVTARLQEPTELEDVLRTAADEIRQAFKSDWVVVRLAPDEMASEPTDGQDQGDGHA